MVESNSNNTNIVVLAQFMEHLTPKEKPINKIINAFIVFITKPQRIEYIRNKRMPPLDNIQ
jgi:hypothetical protein